MKVVHIVNADIIGGAPKAAFSLNKALQEIGIDSKMLVQRKFSNDYGIFSVSNTFLKKQKANARMFFDLVQMKMFTNTRRGRFSFGYIGLDITKNDLIRDADLLHIHWINEGFLSIKSVSELGELNKPIVWTLHDMWAFTGGCHYSLGCEKFLSQCFECPSLKFPCKNDFSRKVFNGKVNSYKNLNFVIVTCSKWLATKAEQSFLFKNKRINVIPNTLDVNVYKPIDKNKARVVFNLPQDKLLILFGTMSLKDYRKGFELLKGSLNYLSQTYPVYKDKIEVIIFGSSEQSHSLNIPYKNSFLGKLRSKEEISFCYNAADVFVAPSIEDNLPNAVMESLSCGTPVVAFEIGGMPDMIVHKKNGYLAEPNSIQSLSNGIYWILTDDTKRKQLGFSAREKVLKNFTYESIATKYIQLYNSIL